jgi:hypothetical protein
MRRGPKRFGRSLSPVIWAVNGKGRGQSRGTGRHSDSGTCQSDQKVAPPGDHALEPLGSAWKGLSADNTALRERCRPGGPPIFRWVPGAGYPPKVGHCRWAFYSSLLDFSQTRPIMVSGHTLPKGALAKPGYLVYIQSHVLLGCQESGAQSPETWCGL